MKKIQALVFRNIQEEEWKEMQKLTCMRTASFEKHTVIFAAGDQARELGIVLRGSVNVESMDLWGNRSILSNIAPGHIFAESYALCHEPMMVDAVAAEPCEILFVNCNLLMDSRNAGRSWYPKMLANLLEAAARKNMVLSGRMFCTSAKTVRGRLLTYLSAQSMKCGSTTFQVPFDRQQMADYLNLDRSALSKELGKMRDEGMLEFHKNTFRLNVREEG